MLGYILLTLWSQKCHFTIIENQTAAIFDLIASTEALKASTLRKIKKHFTPINVKKTPDKL